jgi:hypothetical protein
MERMEGYVKVLEKSTSLPPTMRGGFKYCTQNDPKGGKRLKFYGPLIKSSGPPQSEPTHDEPSAGKTEESNKSSS